MSSLLRRALVRVARSQWGYTLLELLLVTAIIISIALMIVPSFVEYFADAKFKEAVLEITMLQADISAYVLIHDEAPPTLDLIDRDVPTDPWGNPYVYYRFQGNKNWKGKARKDRFLVPINSTYDLYSLGPDGLSRPPLQNPKSHDDVVRANDGGFIGWGKDF